ncbi:MAG: PKD domain-containing protein [Saprospiraceae bacterium]|nr:PKD domain-containing protein [Saprospiraceae bacterium]
MTTRLKIVSALLLLSVFAAPGALQSQCSRVGWVASVTPGCGAMIIDLDNGSVLRAVGGVETLYGGKTIRFASQPAILPAGCQPDGFQVVALTCVSDTLPCTAQFTHVTNALNSFTISFNAEVYDPSSQQCSWIFGDGASASGANVQHTFPNEGYYQVCLTVADAFGCSTQHCKNVWVSQQNPNWCGYDVYATAVGTELIGKVSPLGSGSWNLESVTWYNSKTNQILGNSPDLTYTLPGNGNYLICAEYTTKNPDDNAICTTTRCQQLNITEPGCYSYAIANQTDFCPNFFAPVCGCDGQTYLNECEAMNNGLTGWWAGECGSSSSCGSDLNFKVVGGNPVNGYTVRFFNLTSGDYNLTQLDFGDDSPICEASQWDSIEHVYTEGGIYRANLTAWKPNNCVSSVTKLIVTDAINLSSSQVPGMTDYVMPGDANGDKKANVHDLLNLGNAYSFSGPPRPNASSSWTPQFAPNWTANTAGVNTKHADCDGNGLVNEFDADPIEQHYAPLDTQAVLHLPGAPKVWVEFAQDTIVVTPANVATLEISADLMVGSEAAPAMGIYGLAFALKYPEVARHDPDADYEDNSFFGITNHFLWLPKDIHSRRQMDMGFVRKNGSTVSGYGRLAKIVFQADFIIIVDVVDRTSSSLIPFTVDVRSLKAVDADGNELTLSVPAIQDTLWLKVEQLTSTETPSNEPQVMVFPNPATDQVSVLCPEGDLQRVEVINALGQTVQRLELSGGRSLRLSTEGWSKGMFTLRLQTGQGIVEKRLLVH